jgi:urease accessory protein
MSHIDNTTVNRSHLTMLTTAAILATPLAQAHHMMGGKTPDTFLQGLLSGIAHPVIGIDHFAFLVVAALLAFTLKGSARYLVPLAFVGATVAGTLYHVGAQDLPMAEVMVALSVLLGGVAVFLKRSVPALLMGALFGVIGVFHGYAYGESIVGAEQTPLVSYLLGFAMIQYLVIAGGTKAMQLLAARSTRIQDLATRSGAAFATITGGVFLAMNLA